MRATHSTFSIEQVTLINVKFRIAQMSSRLRNAALVLALSATLSACPSLEPNGTGAAPPSETSPTVPLTVIVRAARGAPDDFGVVPGDLVAGAKVSVGAIDFPGTEAAGGITDESGRLVLRVSSGRYAVQVELGTHDPYCYWYGGAEVEVKDESTQVSVDDLWVLCE